jgi:hypothetical protein
MVLGQGFEPMDFQFPTGSQKNAIVPLLHRAPDEFEFAVLPVL